MTTDELLVAAAHGDERAFETFYDQLAAPVLGLVRAVVGDEARSQEVVREVFVQLWRTAPSFRPDLGGARAWAMTIAHRRAVDGKRAAHAREHPDGEHDGVVEGVLDDLDQGPVSSCLRTLTDLERESILLAYYQALTYGQVAGTLRVATGTVQHGMRTGLRRLRDGLARDRTVASGASH